MDQFKKVLDKDPKNEIATASIASIYFNEKNFDKAAEWNQKLIAIKPDSKEAYYTLGVIAWTKWVAGGSDRAAEMKDEAAKIQAR